MTAGAGWGVYGQEPAVGALRAALRADRLGHAYLFTGPEGVGKATLARRLAQALLCEQPVDGDPCLECRACTRVEAGEAPDVDFVAIGGPCAEEGHRSHDDDGSTRIRICQARRLSKLASLAPFHAPRRVFVIDTADDLQTEAAHALLKTIEEPPASALLILLATDPDELLPTIRSRCQRLALRPMPHADLAAALAARLALDGAEADHLAALARGRYGLALRLHEDPSLRQLQASATEGIRRLARASRNERLDFAQRLAGGWRRERQSVLDTLDVWRWWWRDVLAHAAGLEPRAGAVPDGLAAHAALCSARDAALALRATQRARQHLLENTNPQLALEVLMLDLPALPALDHDANGEEARLTAAPPA